MAATKGYADVAELLLKNGANVEHEDHVRYSMGKRVPNIKGVTLSAGYKSEYLYVRSFQILNQFWLCTLNGMANHM